MTLGPRGSPAFTLATDDGQAIVSMYDGSIATRAGEKAVRVALQPLDAATLAAPPAGKTFASNAYRLTAAYTTSKLPARFASPSCPVEQQPKLCPTLLLRYATSGSALVRAEHGSWTAVPGALDSAASVQFFADIGAAGDFAVVASPSAPPATKGPSALTIVGIALGALAVLAGVFMRLGPRRRRRA